MKKIHIENSFDRGLIFTGILLADVNYREDEKDFSLSVYLTSNKLVVFKAEVPYENGSSIVKSQVVEIDLFQFSFFQFFPENEWTAMLFSKAFKEGRGKEIFRKYLDPIDLDVEHRAINRMDIAHHGGPRGFII